MNTITMSIISESRKLLEAQSSSPPVATPVASATTTAADIVFPVTLLTLTCVLALLGYLSFYVGRHTVESIPTTFTAPDGGGQPPENDGVLHCLPIIKVYYKAEALENNNDCSICLEEFRDGDNIKAIPNCGHLYHPRCVDTWLAMKLTCPMCRSNQAGVGPLN